MIFRLLALVAITNAQFLLHHGSCSGRCFTANDFMKSCQCDSDCETFNICCGDFQRLCRGSEIGLVVTQSELDSFAQSLWDNDYNRVDAALLNLNIQGRTNGTINNDVASGPLMMPTDDQLEAILNSPNKTYSTFIKLLNNTEIGVRLQETRPVDEIQEENNFIAMSSQTKVMQLTFQFLRDNGFIKGDQHAFGTVMNELWFNWYNQRNGFESVMIGEKLKNNGNHHHANITHHIRGLDNWVQFYQEEKAGRLDYLGYKQILQDPPVVGVRFMWHQAFGTSFFFVGTSPEFDMGLYTVCALARSNQPCRFTINGHKLWTTVNTATHTNIKHILDVSLHSNATTVVSGNE